MTSRDFTLSLRGYSYAVSRSSEKVLRCKLCGEEICVGDLVHSNKHSIRVVKYYHMACWMKLQQ